MDRSHFGESLTTTLADRPSGKQNIRTKKTKDDPGRDQWIDKLKKKCKSWEDTKKMGRLVCGGRRLLRPYAPHGLNRIKSNLSY